MYQFPWFSVQQIAKCDVDHQSRVDGGERQQTELEEAGCERRDDAWPPARFSDTRTTQIQTLETFLDKYETRLEKSNFPPNRNHTGELTNPPGRRAPPPLSDSWSCCLNTKHPTHCLFFSLLESSLFHFHLILGKLFPPWELLDWMAWSPVLPHHFLPSD